MSNPLAVVPQKVRLILYLVWAILGPVLIYTAAKGWTGDAEYALWVGLGTALGLMAASNVKQPPS